MLCTSMSVKFCLISVDIGIQQSNPVTLQPQPMDLYRWVAWLDWVPNLLLIELYIRTKIIEDC